MIITFLLFVVLLHLIPAEEWISSSGAITNVEHALKASFHGGTAFVAKASDGVVLWYEDNNHDEFFENQKDKVVSFSETLHMISSGSCGDVNILHEIAAKQYLNMVDKGVSVRRLADSVANMMHDLTCTNTRVFGLSALFIGLDQNPEVIEIDPYGSMRSCGVACIGKNSKNILEKWRSRTALIDYCNSKLRYNLSAQELSFEMLRCLSDIFENAEDVDVVHNEKNFLDFRQIKSKYRMRCRILSYISNSN